MEDLHAFNLHHARTSALARRSRAQVRWALTLLLAALLVTLGLSIHAPLAFWLLGTLILGGWFSLFPHRLEQVLRRHTEKMFASGKNTGFLGAHQVLLEEEWLVEETHWRQVRTHWRAVESVLMTPAHLFLFLSSFSAVIIPRAAFPDLAAAEAFLRLCEQRRQLALTLASELA